MVYPNWEDCTPEQKEARRVAFGSVSSPLERAIAYNAALIARYEAGLYLSKADKRDARRLLKVLRAAN